MKSALEDSALPKTVHDLKSALHHFGEQGIALAGMKHDPMLYSYLLDPTYSSHSLPEVALRRFTLELSANLPEGADVSGTFATALHKEDEHQRLTPVYEELAAPLVA